MIRVQQIPSLTAVSTGEVSAGGLAAGCELIVTVVSTGSVGSDGECVCDGLFAVEVAAFEPRSGPFSCQNAIRSCQN